jgi:hypothetical protein
MFVSDVNVSESGALTEDTTVVFWAKTCGADMKATRAIGARHPASREKFLSICTP